MNKDTRKRFEKAFRYGWPLYFLLPLLAGVTISYLFAVVHEPASYEKLNVFVASKSLDGVAFSNRLEEKLSPSGLKKASTTQGNPSDSLFSQKLSVVGYNGSDLFLLPQSVLSGLAAEDVFLPFSEDFVATHAKEANPVYYQTEEGIYGIRVKAKGETSWLSSSVGFLDEDYYLSLNATSKNLGNYGLYDNPTYDLALQAFDFLQGDGQ